MDPDANVRERIALYDGAMTYDALDVERMSELEQAYRDWRAAGGFAADVTLLAELLTARQEYRAGRPA